MGILLRGKVRIMLSERELVMESAKQKA
ncbi:hypothetical protein FHW67_003950, partial [Herbaspirillum sp. Sphag1AN]|nr:hypothetical protein [Herbaspirillum sp. Sphag1AN]MBB3247775.1 hypothetical protein [Herbaspirillum sp. Sphag64]